MSRRDAAGVPVPRAFLDRLVSGVRVPVSIDAEPGNDVPWPRCTARIDELGLRHSDIGADAAIVGLASRLEAAVKDGLLIDCAEEQMLMVLRLYLASSDRALGRLLQRAAMFSGQDDHEY